MTPGPAALTEPTHPWAPAVVWGPALRFQGCPRVRSALSPGHHAVLGRDRFLRLSSFCWSSGAHEFWRRICPLSSSPDPPAAGFTTAIRADQRQSRQETDGAWPKCLPIPGLAVSYGGGPCPPPKKKIFPGLVVRRSSAPAAVLQCRIDWCWLVFGCCSRSPVRSTGGLSVRRPGLVPILSVRGPSASGLPTPSGFAGQQSPHQRAVESPRSDVPTVLPVVSEARAPAVASSNPASTSYATRMLLGSTGSTHSRLLTFGYVGW